MTVAGHTIWPALFVDQRGNKRAGLPITVYVAGKGPAPAGDGTLVKADLFTDDALTVPGPNPVTTDADGNETAIKAAPGTYDAYVGGETIRFTVNPEPGSSLRVPDGELSDPGLKVGAAATGLVRMDDGNLAFVVDGSLRFHTSGQAGTGLRRDVGDPIAAGGRIYVEDELFVEDDIWGDEGVQLSAGNVPPATTTLIDPADAGARTITVAAVPPSWVVDKTIHLVKTIGAQYDRPRILDIQGLVVTLDSPLRWSYTAGTTVSENPWRGALWPTASWPVPSGVMSIGADLTAAEVAATAATQVVLLNANHCRYRAGLAKLFSPDWIAEGGLTTATGGFALSVSAAIFAKDADVCASTTQALVVSAPHATLPRIDIVVLNASGVASVVAGTPNASPATPATPVGSLLVAQVAVAAAAASIVQGNITWKLDRPMRLRVADAANGGYVFGPRDDTGVRVRIYDGSFRIVEGLQDGAFASLDLNLSGGQVTVGPGGLKVTGPFGANGATPQTKATLPAAATDLASALTLLNGIRSALIANGIAQ